ncbi:hypothetical protein NW759_015570, partial [Fusarium solani]
LQSPPKRQPKDSTAFQPLQMSGLEAVAAFSLACNVLQVLEAAYKVAGACKRIYQTGQPDSATLGHNALQLRNISHRLGNQLNDITTNPLSHDDSLLRDLAAQCAATANELLDQITSVSNTKILGDET